MTFCGGERSVKRSLDDPAPPHTKHTKTAVPQITESSQVEVRAVVGRRVRDLVRLDGDYDLLFFEVAALVDVNHVEYRPRRAQELGSEFGVGRQSRALAALALVGQLLQPLREAAVDGFLPARGRG